MIPFVHVSHLVAFFRGWPFTVSQIVFLNVDHLKCSSLGGTCLACRESANRCVWIGVDQKNRTLDPKHLAKRAIASKPWRVAVYQLLCRDTIRTCQFFGSTDPCPFRRSFFFIIVGCALYGYWRKFQKMAHTSAKKRLSPWRWVRSRPSKVGIELRKL